jgi:hypothetical protein
LGPRKLPLIQALRSCLKGGALSGSSACVLKMKELRQLTNGHDEAHPTAVVQLPSLNPFHANYCLSTVMTIMQTMCGRALDV